MERRGAGLLQIRPFNVSDFGQIDLTICKHIETERNIEPYALQINDVIFNNTNSEELVGKTALWVSTNKAVLSNHMTIVRVADRAAADARFIAFYLLYMWYHGYFRMVCRRHVNQASVSRERLCETPLPDFDVDRQRRIAGVLTAVQHAVEQKGRVIALTGKLKKSLVQTLLTDGTRGERQKKSAIGPIPQSWHVVEIGSLFSVAPNNGVYKPRSLYGDGTLILRIDDFSNDGDTVVSAGNRVRADADDIRRYGLAEDDIVVNRVNSLSHLGKTAIIGMLTEPMLFESNMMRFRVNEQKVLPEYALRLLNSPICKKQIVGGAKRAVAQSSINQGDVGGLRVPLPELDEQEEIVNAVNCAATRIEQHRKAQRMLQDLFRTLLHQLMTARIRVDQVDLSELKSLGIEVD